MSVSREHSTARGDTLLSESLRLLAAAHYLLAAITLLMAPAGVYLAWAGWSMLHPTREDAWTPRPGQEIFDPILWGTTFYLAGGALAALSVVHCAVLAYVGRCIALRKRRGLCLMFSVFDLTYLPLGTTLSVFSLLLLLNPQIKQEFKNVSDAPVTHVVIVYRFRTLFFRGK